MASLWPVFVVAGLWACGDAERPPTARRPEPAKPVLRLILLNDLEGTLEPCGCQTRPLGGIDRAAGAIERLAADGTPQLLLSVGQLFSARGAHAGADEHAEAAAKALAEADAAQRRAGAQTLAEALSRMGLYAIAPAAEELNSDREALVALSQRAGAQLLGAGPGAQPGEADADRRILERGGLRIGIFGLVSDEAAPNPVDLRGPARTLASELKREGAQVVVAMVSGGLRQARRIADGVAEVDFVIHGGVAGSELAVPEAVGSSTLLRAGRHGEALIAVDLHWRGTEHGPFVDHSAWSRTARRENLERSTGELQQRIDAWAQKSDVDAAELERQRVRLKAMRDELKKDQDPSAPPAGNYFSARSIEIDPKVEPSKAVAELLDAHDARVNAHNRQALAAIAPSPVPPGSAGYAGSEACGRCHQPALGWWKAHPHGRAYATLEARNKQFNLECVACHVTGYGKPGGAAVVQNEGLRNVGCESCHGPASQHIADPKAAGLVRREVPETTCVGCHNEEHSDRFEYQAFRSMLMVPGHGKPVPEGG